MHVHGSYGQQLTALGTGPSVTREVAARRSAEVRKRLSLAAEALTGAGDAIEAVHTRDDEKAHENPRGQEQAEDEFGQFFSARV